MKLRDGYFPTPEFWGLIIFLVLDLEILGIIFGNNP